MDRKMKLVAGLAIVVFAVAACDDGGGDATSPPAPLPETSEPADGAASPAAGDTEASPAADAASPAADGAASPAADGAASPAADGAEATSPAAPEIDASPEA